ncbi:MAG TPA: glycosyltransferase [Acidimicrobiales bacterium]|jgi:predicted glycosyltransferase
MTRPRLLFHCQHSLGLGHLVRSLALASGLAEHFDVVLLNGGRLPEGARVPEDVRLVNLPPLGHDAAHRLVSHDPELTVDEAMDLRRDLVLRTYRDTAPAVVLVELYPFGRRKFEFELLPLLDAVAATPDRPLVVCSVRDILVGRDDGGRHDERASRRANASFDAVLVHADPAFARLEESFHPRTPLAVPVHHTGFVAPEAPPADAPPVERVLVSAGGGMVGAPLFRAAADAAGAVHRRTGLPTTIVAGPFLPRDALAELRARAAEAPELDVVSRVDDLAGEIRRSTVSVSQCGYNTTLDLLRAGTPAVVVPYADAGEDEQTRRAERLAAMGALRAVHPAELDGDRLAEEVVELVRFRPAPVALDLDGRRRSARIVAELAGVLR